MLSVLSFAAAAAAGDARWSEKQIVHYMTDNPQRVFFSRLFRDGGFRKGLEVGVAGGKFSEHMLLDNAATSPLVWHMMEPFPISSLLARYDAFAQTSTERATAERERTMSWRSRGVGKNAELRAIRHLSTDAAALAAISDGPLYDFIYLDGAHDYFNVKLEMYAYWPKVRPGGVLAGHDYCSYGETNAPGPKGSNSVWQNGTLVPVAQTKGVAGRDKRLPMRCARCRPIPRCGNYTSTMRGIKSQRGRGVKSQVGVVQAVQEWLADAQPTLKLHHTKEDFTRGSLAAAGIDYDLSITTTRNPSWFVVKPLV
mmetsp:Transcript_30090/g.96274  ORF Transcript_30090/g.96274 Transcript_30090/m.96274 type:complete len:311 (+) Transcript_30090:31-963(+)